MSFLFYFLNVASSVGQSALSKQYAVKHGNATVFNINKALAGSAAFLFLGVLTGMSFHVPTLLFGIGYGIVLCFSMHFGFRALSTGPMALTSIIASFSLVIPFVFGIAVWKEPISVCGRIGIVCLLIAILLFNAKKEKNNISLKWFIYAILTLLTNGICSLIQKYHQLYFPKLYRMEFMLFSLCCVLLILTVQQTAAHGRNRPSFHFSTQGMVAGVLNSTANYSVLYLSATEKASVLFPVISVVNVIGAWFIGMVVFKERLTFLQICGLVTGITAVLLLNI